MKKCILCGKREYSEKIARNEFFKWNTLFCNKCKLAYADCDDKIMKKAYVAYYKNNYWHAEIGERDFKTAVEKLKRFIVSLGVFPLINVSHSYMINKYVPKGKMLDIGAGQGDAMHFFYKKGYEVYGIEPDEINVSRINKSFKKHFCEAKDAETELISGKYDLIYLCHVLEHFVYPLDFLVNIKKNLNKKGIIFVEVPNLNNAAMRKKTLDMQCHVYHYTLESLKKIFKKAGLKIVEAGIYRDVSPNLASSFFRSIFNKYSYASTSSDDGDKLVLIAKC
jgi:2-polyprenyl-3-methyl-5-hydroxy-6-metoxy-1,4-benzoquinol methylase